jgi:hypothetical protein
MPDAETNETEAASSPAMPAATRLRVPRIASHSAVASRRKPRGSGAVAGEALARECGFCEPYPIGGAGGDGFIVEVVGRIVQLRAVAVYRCR